MRITIGGSMAMLLLSCLKLTSAATNELIYGGDSYTANTSGNKTVVLEWTLSDSGSSHTIRCTADPSGDINPALKWWRLEGYDLTENMSIPNTVVDTSNPKDIAITFSLVNYNHIGDYYCISTDSTPNSRAPANETNFRVRVSSVVKITLHTSKSHCDVNYCDFCDFM